MERNEVFQNYIKKFDDDSQKMLKPFVENMIFIEKQLEDLRMLPFIEVKTGDPTKQRPTTAGKMFKELNQQYNNGIKILLSAGNTEDGDDLCDLEKYFRTFTTR